MKASWLRRRWQPLKTWLSRAGGARVVGGFVGGDGEFLPDTRLSNTCAIDAPGQLQIGDHVFVGHFCVLDASGGLRIGEGCQLSTGAAVFTHSSHVAIRLYGRAYARSAEKHAYFAVPVEIGDYSFIGVRATLLPGTRLGRGCLVAAHSLVKGSFPDFSFIGGNPAQVLGDTRTMDAAHLAAHPELLSHYEAWAGRGALAGAPRARGR